MICDAAGDSALQQHRNLNEGLRKQLEMTFESSVTWCIIIKSPYLYDQGLRPKHRSMYRSLMMPIINHALYCYLSQWL